MEAKFKKGQAVVYVKGNSVELGIVKTVVPTEMKYAKKQDGPFGEPTGETYIGHKYFVNYHTGDTAALTNESDLHEINNEDCFKIKRIKAK